MARFALVCLLVWSSCASALGRAQEASVVAPGNPHIPRDMKMEEQCGNSCECQAQSIVVTAANVVQHLPAQQDTFLRIEPKNVAGVDVSIYHFKQPGRLSDLELPFKLLPLRTIALDDVQELQVPPKQAMDSWFPGYAWSILVCARCEGTHIGWKFTPTTADANAQAFYALIVETIESEEEKLSVPIADRLFTGLRVAARPLAALGLTASVLQAATSS